MTQVPASPRIGMVAGEASGDLLAGLMLGGMKQRWPGLQTFGIGGPRMAEQGFQAWWPHEKLAVNGLVEVLQHFPELYRIRRDLGDRLLRERPDAFIGVDAPDFNLGLEKRLKRAGIRSIHFVSPSIWAWRGKRILTIGESVDHVLCLFPFEPEIYRKQGIAATYVGHPLADAIPLVPPRAESRAALGLSESDQVVALLPGSRRSEVRNIAPRVLAAAALMHRQRPGLRYVLPVVPGRLDIIEPLIAEHAPGVPIDVLHGRSHEALAACDVTLIASGTATLEAALFKKPMVITYVVHWLTAMMMRRMGYLPWVGLPNILLRESAVPEFLQEAATPQALAEATLAWLDDAPRSEALAQRFLNLHHELRRNTAEAARHAIEEILAA